MSLVLDENNTTMKEEKMDQYYMRKRYISLFESNKLSDCSFFIENEEIYSHKLILATSSPVFEAMLFGPLASSKIVIGDILASEFKQMLTFIYSDAVQIMSINNAWALVYIGKKYLIDDLLEYCLDYINNHIEASNVLLNYESSDLFSEKILRETCQNNIQMYANLIFKFDYHMKQSTLRHLLELNDFNIKEEDLLSLSIKWANTECKRLELSNTKDNIRSILFESGILSRIRFLSLPLCAFSDNKIYSEVLIDDEISVLKSCKINESLENETKLKSLNFCLCKSPRNSISLPQRMAVRNIYKTASSFNANYVSQLSTQLVANNHVMVNAICIPPHRQIEKCEKNYNVKIKIKITDVENKEVIGEFYNNKVINYGGINIVKTSEMIIFEKGKTYNVDIFWTDECIPWFLEYPFYHMSPNSENQDVSFQFSDATEYGFVQGICYCYAH